MSQGMQGSRVGVVAIFGLARSSGALFATSTSSIPLVRSLTTNSRSWALQSSTALQRTAPLYRQSKGHRHGRICNAGGQTVRSFAQQKEGKVTYRIWLQTGDLRCAGTTEQLYVVLHGMEGSSHKLILSQHCGRASAVEEMLYVDTELGRLQSMEIGFVDPAGAESTPGGGWLLDRVEVTLLDETKVPPPKPVVFPAMRWLGQSESGSRSGPGKQVLFPMATEQFYPWRWGPNATPKWGHHRASLNDVVLTAVAAAVPHPDKVARGVKGFVSKDFGYAGEDVFVIVNEGPLQLMAVADGVYGWWESGIDSGEYSRMLLSCVKETAVEEVGRAMERAEQQ
eukprot:CAMPEP_0181291660 /NCGR_PEP_ID=MMETSP1101-20121128/2087_1 /TAXON_ID=46948 /ORGANISM="Rhodomonas abbreviata, Strain Caron Lab Isolate" /LENGTH=338 /DNA_ID=CAMNT_0023396069 /DNA_START=145 /DNA_END=1158 /DNA_ORIENTATION=-